MRKGERSAFIVFIILILGTFFLCAMLLKSCKSWMDTRESSKAEEAIKQDVEPKLDKDYPVDPNPKPEPKKKYFEEPSSNELKQPYVEEYPDPDTGERKTGIVITGDKKDHVDRAEKVEKDPAPVEEGVNPSWRDADNGRIDAPE